MCTLNVTGHKGWFPAGFGLLALASCRAVEPPTQDWLYVGSSTVGTFVAAADEYYSRASIQMDTTSESDGGEQAILESACDLAGIAREPRAALAQAGIRVTQIGRDAIAIIAHPAVGVDSISKADLARVLRGEVDSWAQLGGEDIRLVSFVVAPGSATRGVLREQLLQGSDVVGAQQVQPDAALVSRVAASPGGIGAISFAFLDGASGVQALAVDGQRPSEANFDYPLARPLNLLWRPTNRMVGHFVDWALSPAGQRVVMRHFVGLDVRGSVQARAQESQDLALGYLTVLTQTNEQLDGGVLYYTHRPYDLLTRHGTFLRRVRNHRGNNDERPTRIALPPGVYLVRTETSAAGTVEFFATVSAGRSTELDVLKRLVERRP